jgi:hypothetical protein
MKSFALIRIRPSTTRILFAIGLCAMLAGPGAAVADSVTTFSSGPYVLPETISQAPSTFGNFAGNYIIPDFNAGNPNGNVWAVGPAGGPPVSIATNGSVAVRGGVFLPSNWGSNAGAFLEAGYSTGGNGTQAGAPAPVLIVSANGTVTPFSSLMVAAGQPAVVPTSFGNFGGQVAIPNYDPNSPTSVGTVTMLATNGTSTTLASGSALPAATAAAAFAPAGFGAKSGKLFVDGLNGNQIVSISADGTVTPFATVPLKTGQVSPFQMAFSPAGFLAGQGPLLFVSVRGSTTGGGTMGDVLAYNSDGQEVASFQAGPGLISFDPRGLLFIVDPSNPNQTDLLVSNAEPEILLVPSSAFVAVPEPASLAFGLLGGIGLALVRRGKRG